MTTEARRRHARNGRLAEWAAAQALRLRGWRILARNVRNRGGEIDIVARRGRTLAIVEVKQRGARGAGLEAVDARKRGRLHRAAEAYLAAHAACAGLDVRFDVVVVTPWAWPHHVADAWRI